jgi:hypothetical protein
VDDVSMATIRRAADEEAADQLIEPITATLTLKGRAASRVVALDHGGRKTDPPIPVPVTRTPEGCRVTLDGNKTRTVYYLIEF